MTNAKPMKSTEDLEDIFKEERAIKASGLRYRRVSLTREEIDLRHSQTFNARFENRVNDEIVLRYALLMERGTRFPMVTVFFDMTLRKFVVISGVHRVTAHEAAGITSKIEAFEIVVDPPGDAIIMEKVADLGVVLNTTAGFGLSRAEALAAAVRAIVDREESASDVAERLGLRFEDVVDACEIWKLDRELLHLGLDPSIFFRKGDKRAVLTLPSVQWMVEVQRLLSAANLRDKKTGMPLLSGVGLAEVVRDLRAERDDVRRQEIIVAARRNLLDGKKPDRQREPVPETASARGRNPYFVFRRGVGSLKQISPAELAATRCTSADSAKALLEEISSTRDLLNQFDDAVRVRWELR